MVAPLLADPLLESCDDDGSLALPTPPQRLHARTLAGRRRAKTGKVAMIYLSQLSRGEHIYTFSTYFDRETVQFL